MKKLIAALVAASFMGSAFAQAPAPASVGDKPAVVSAKKAHKHKAHKKAKHKKVKIHKKSA